jgi:hypothetical protein
LASSGYAEATREALATHIIDLAKTGERDVIRLRDNAVAFVLQARFSQNRTGSFMDYAIARGRSAGDRDRPMQSPEQPYAW